MVDDRKTPEEVIVTHVCTQERSIAKLESNQEHFMSDLKDMQCSIRKIEQAIVGNGRPGLRQKWESVHESINKLWVVVMGSLVLVAVKLLIEAFT